MIVPAEEVAANPAVPAAHIVAPVEDVIVGTAVTVPVADTVAEAEVDEPSRKVINMFTTDALLYGWRSRGDWC